MPVAWGIEARISELSVVGTPVEATLVIIRLIVIPSAIAAVVRICTAVWVGTIVVRVVVCCVRVLLRVWVRRVVFQGEDCDMKKMG